jgi:hypothetical protein
MSQKLIDFSSAIQADRLRDMLLANLRSTAAIISPLFFLGMVLELMLAITPRPTPHELGGYILLLAAVLAGFVFLTVFELWAIRRLGFDVLGQLKMKGRKGSVSFTFEAVGVIVFMIVQPVVLSYLLRELLASVIADIAAHP